MIEAEDTYPLRHKILRPGEPLETCWFDGDFAEETFHLGIYDQSLLVCIGSFYQHSHHTIHSVKSYQLRGMVTEPAYQKRGFGREIIQAAKVILKEQSAELLWCNARLSARFYYQKLGFQEYGEVFQNQYGIDHIVMFTKLDAISPQSRFCLV